MICFRYINYFKLIKAARYVSIDTTFCETSLKANLIPEVIFVIVHPNIFFKNVLVTTGKELNLEEETLYYVNDFLLSFTMLRVYLILFAIVANTKFYSGKADRVM